MESNLARFDLEQMDSSLKGRAPFGRRRALGALGAALFGAAVKMALPKGSSASHLPIPSPCVYEGRCHGCSGSTCTTCGGVGSYGCFSGGQCWYAYGYDAVGCYAEFRCCDWIEGGAGSDICICRQQTNTWCR